MWKFIVHGKASSCKTIQHVSLLKTFREFFLVSGTLYIVALWKYDFDVNQIEQLQKYGRGYVDN